MVAIALAAGFYRLTLALSYTSSPHWRLLWKPWKPVMLVEYCATFRNSSCCVLHSVRDRSCMYTKITAFKPRRPPVFCNRCLWTRLTFQLSYYSLTPETDLAWVNFAARITRLSIIFLFSWFTLNLVTPITTISHIMKWNCIPDVSEFENGSNLIWGQQKVITVVWTVLLILSLTLKGHFCTLSQIKVQHYQ